MKSLFIKWHFHCYKHHLKWASAYTGVDEKKAMNHLCKFLDHNRYLCKHAPQVITDYQVVLLAKAFPDESTA